MFAVFLKHVWLGTDGAAVDVRIQSYNEVAVALQRFRLELLLYHPTVGIGGILDGHKVACNALHGRIEHIAGTSHRLGADEVARLGEQHAQRQHEDDHCHHQDAKGELGGERLTDIKHCRPPF